MEPIESDGLDERLARHYRNRMVFDRKMEEVFERIALERQQLLDQVKQVRVELLKLKEIAEELLEDINSQ